MPGLGGIYSITASENLTNCASHGEQSACPRCKDRTDADILAEVVTVQEEGVHRGNPQANVLISDWGWRGHGDAPDIIARLPTNVWLMSVSEWNLPITRGGVASTVGEYSISAVGPGPRALSHWQAAQERGLKTGTEIQFNNTCEIATVPYLPVMDLVAEHCHNLLTKAHLDAMFIGWTMGGHPSPNIELARRLSRRPVPSIDSVLNEIAAQRYGTEGVFHARQAWTTMSEAFREYPFHISVVYTCPVQWGSANPLYAEKTGYSATMWGIPYDNLDGWRGPYPADVFADQFEKVAQGWKPGIEALQRATETRTRGHARSRRDRSAQRPGGGEPLPGRGQPVPLRSRSRRARRSRCGAHARTAGGAPPTDARGRAVRDRAGQGTLHAGEGRFADRLRAVLPIFLLAAGFGREGAELPVAVAELVARGGNGSNMVAVHGVPTLQDTS